MINKRTPVHSSIYKKSYAASLFLRGVINKVGQLRFLGISEYYRAARSELPNTNQIALVAIVKDEAPYLQEWVDYHLLLGVDHIFIYDNESTDHIYSVIRPYILQNKLTYIKFPGKGVQEKAYMNCVAKIKNQFGWVLCIDIDEFLQPLTDLSLHEWLRNIPDQVSQIEIGWMLFGSSGFKTRPSGLVIENYLHHAQNQFLSDYKPIARPSRITGMKFPHAFEVIGNTVNEAGKRLYSYPFWNRRGATPAPRKLFRINHYYCKSYEEFLKKSGRGDASVPDRKPRGDFEFKEHDQNDVFDDSMLPYAMKLKAEAHKNEK
ncbi:glycosyltransferase family 2 protein [Lacticaseibacillus paracasei]|uniref:glycosyltransferase family 2 protein n=1 Tax=Lacticaseibacillus paracasei TaxID=1597 RepID=UPI0025A11FE4|nr:glycosyltransferase family 2 protein [Lacticaseibacillus paracasei]MDM7530317.1 glycosyltransferase family 2 protein [Lacticaseibacillus paracasei]MDM7542637.1 glycosyltransferase family 2 protein [Lacticaseibacillus paracasei]